MINKYQCLKNQSVVYKDFKLVPIRYEDRYEIMKWRNEQIFHLRQTHPLTEAQQDKYFENVILGLFQSENPEQILFSFIKGDDCLGYGGLVHIDWNNQNAELSFLIDTSLEKENFVIFWVAFLTMIKRIAFKELNLHKIYTYAFDLRPRLYEALNESGFKVVSRLYEHVIIDSTYIDVIIHSCFNPRTSFFSRLATKEDINLYYSWVNDDEVRMNSINSRLITFDTHALWFNSKLNDSNSILYVFEDKFKTPLGQVRLSKVENYWLISYSIDKAFRGLGLGQTFIDHLLKIYPSDSFRAIVKYDNTASIYVFRKLNFTEFRNEELGILQFQLSR